MAGMISPEVIEKVRQAVDIVDVIDSYVPLKKAGTYYKALSPFNKEKTPSFMVNPSRQTFKCYSSGLGGDVFRFLMLYESIDFPSAVRRLAERASIHIPEEGGRATGGIKREARDALLQIHAQLSVYWRDLLAHDERAEVARAYLHRREIPLSWIEEYSLGFAPESWDDTVKWLRRNRFPEEAGVKAGVLVQKEAGGCYDRFRGRLIFPVHNEQGQVVAFSARTLNPDAKEAKYVNSPETPIFLKSKTLYGFHLAKRAIMDADRTVLVEGQIDVLRCHAAGIANVVAPLGTALTEEHCRLMKRCSPNILLCLDSDRAGLKAAERAAELLIKGDLGLEALVQSDLGIEVVELPEGEDPDSMIRLQGTETFEELLKRPREYVDFLLDQLLKGSSPNDPRTQRRAVEGVVNFLGKVPTAIGRERLLAKAALRLQLPEQVMRDEVQAVNRREAQRKKFRESAPPREEREEVEEIPVELPVECHPRVQALLLLLLNDPNLIPEFQRTLDVGWLRGFSGLDLLMRIVDTFNEDLWEDISGLMSIVSGTEQDYLSGLPLEDLAGLTHEQGTEELGRIRRDLQMEWTNGRLKLLAQRLRDPGDGTLNRSEVLAEQRKLLGVKKNLTRG